MLRAKPWAWGSGVKDMSQKRNIIWYPAQKQNTASFLLFQWLDERREKRINLLTIRSDQKVLSKSGS